MNRKAVSVSEFSRRIGLSRQRLYGLLAEGSGPPRLPDGKIPLGAGIAWHESRQERLAPWMKQQSVKLSASVKAKQALQRLEAGHAE